MPISFATAVFAAIFVIGEYINGAAKNIVGKGYARWQIFLAKYIVVMASAVLQLLVLSAVAIICGAVVEGTEQFDATEPIQIPPLSHSKPADFCFFSIYKIPRLIN